MLQVATAQQVARRHIERFSDKRQVAQARIAVAVFDLVQLAFYRARLQRQIVQGPAAFGAQPLQPLPERLVWQPIGVGVAHRVAVFTRAVTAASNSAFSLRLSAL